MSLKNYIVGDNSHIFYLRLRYQEPVERVAVNIRQRIDSRYMAKVDPQMSIPACRTRSAKKSSGLSGSLNLPRPNLIDAS